MAFIKVCIFVNGLGADFNACLRWRQSFWAKYPCKDGKLVLNQKCVKYGLATKSSLHTENQSAGCFFAP